MEVFISYKSDDRSRVQPIVELLRSANLNTWWDRDIPSGAPWEASITTALRAARCTVVVWTTSSVHPDTGARVQVEAREALNSGKLVQVLLDPVAPPLFFGQYQAIDLSNWKGDVAAPHGAVVVAAVKAILAGEKPRLVAPHSGGPGAIGRQVRLDASPTANYTRFSLVREIPTAVFMGPGTWSRNPIIRLISMPSRKEQSGYTIRNFDWDGEDRVIRPCDVHIGADEWDLTNGNHKWNATLSEESFATLFSIFVQYGVLFGNGRQWMFRPHTHEARSVEALDFSIESGFGASADRKSVGVIERKNGSPFSLALLKDDGVRGMTVERIPLDRPEEGLDTYSIYFDPADDQTAFCFQAASYLTQERLRILRISLTDKKQTHSSFVSGLHNISRSRTRAELLAITSGDLIRLNARTLAVIDVLALQKPRDNVLPYNHAVSYSPCGRRVALAYGVAGEIEIRDPDTLTLQLTLETEGIPERNFEWSPDGNFLAAEIRPRSRKAPHLVVWDVGRGEVAGTFPDIQHQRSVTRPGTFPRTFYWHRRYSEFMMLTSIGRLQHYRLG